MANLVTVTIDGVEIKVPANTLIVDAAKQAGIDIPVFCYHPKMDPVGMCRMCLVEVGRPAIDRETRQPIREEDGRLRILFGPKLETACTTAVSDNMVVIGLSDKVKAARKDVIEFLLTSHPLDCPVCDKGGECPLQNLTMRYGPDVSRFSFSEKMHLAKHLPLGELIWLDRERCIQCGRCVRFQSELAGQPVIGFKHRGRAIEIHTDSDPGFNSVFSGNTTDICPVGALTTADFRFGARPWELNQVGTLCQHCPVGCNLTVNVRREARSDGKMMIKRIMPRQNELVNEIWICDKGRFGYHYAESPERLRKPLLRRGNQLVEVEWEEAIQAAAAMLNSAGANMLALTSGRLANEDLFSFRELSRARDGKTRLYSNTAGGQVTTVLGMHGDHNLAHLGKGAVIIVAGTDLYEEAPIWFLRLRAAVKRGARLITILARPAQLEASASQAIRCAYTEEAGMLRSFIAGTDLSLHDASDLVIFYGGEGLDHAQSQDLALAAGELLQAAGKTESPSSGLIGVWQAPNTQGAWELGFEISPDLATEIRESSLVWVAGADPAGDSPSLSRALAEARYVIAQDLFLSDTARQADLVLPVQSMLEREGTYVNSERRVQRFYRVSQPEADVPADFALVTRIAAAAGVQLEGGSAMQVFRQLSEQVDVFSGINYTRLSEYEKQVPAYGRDTLYYAGTGYANKLGLGAQLPRQTERRPETSFARAFVRPRAGDLWLVPVTRLYDGGALMRATDLLDQRRAGLDLRVHPSELNRLGLNEGENLCFELEGREFDLPLRADSSVPMQSILVARSSGLPVVLPRIIHPTLSEPQALSKGDGERDDQ